SRRCDTARAACRSRPSRAGRAAPGETAAPAPAPGTPSRRRWSRARARAAPAGPRRASGSGSGWSAFRNRAWPRLPSNGTRLVRSLSKLRDAHVAYATLATVPGLPQRSRLQAALRGVRDELELDLLAADPGFRARRAALDRLAPALEGLAWKRLGRKELRRGL